MSVSLIQSKFILIVPVVWDNEAISLVFAFRKTSLPKLVVSAQERDVQEY